MDDHDHLMRRRGTIVLIGFLLVAGYFLITEHTAHFFGVLPYLIFLVCPLMHLFMHHGHSGHQHAHEQAGGSVTGELYSTLVPANGADGQPALKDADGSALVIHANPDDYKTQPIGAAGERIACAVIS